MITKKDKQLIAVVAIFWAILFMLSFVAVGRAEARVALSEPVSYSIGADNCSMFVDGCQWGSALSGVANKDVPNHRKAQALGIWFRVCCACAMHATYR